MSYPMGYQVGRESRDVEVALLNKHIDAQSVLFHELAGIKARLQEQLDAVHTRREQDEEMLTAVSIERGELRTERDTAQAQVAKLEKELLHGAQCAEKYFAHKEETENVQ